MAITGTIRYTLGARDVLTPISAAATVGSILAGYDPAYAYDFGDANLGRPALTGGSALTLQFDLGAVVNLAGVLVWHNADDGSAIGVAANTLSSWGAPAFSRSLAVLPRRGDGRTVKLWTAVGLPARYVQVSVPTNSAAPGLKVQFYGSVRQLTGNAVEAGRQFQWNGRAPNFQYGVDLATPHGFHWVYNLGTGATARGGTLMVTDADATKVQLWHQATGGRDLCLFVPDSGSAEAYLARMAMGPSPGSLSSGSYVSTLDSQLVNRGVNVIQLILEDMTAGGPEWT